MIEKGILPKDTARTPINPMPKDVADTAASDAVRPWDSLNADEKKLFARMAEVYAGFSEYTDAQVGRIVEYLENTNQLDNTSREAASFTIRGLRPCRKRLRQTSAVVRTRSSPTLTSPTKRRA